MFEEYSDSDSDYSPRKPQFSKQKALKRFKTENRQITYECQQLLTRHLKCNNDCLNFNLQKYQNQQIYGRNTKIEPLPLIECNHLNQNNINYRIQVDSELKGQLKNLEKKNSQRMFDFNRFTKKLRYKCSVIAAILGISTQQARTNKMITERITSKKKFNCHQWKRTGLNNKLKKNRTRFCSMHYHLKMSLLPISQTEIQVPSNFESFQHLLGVRYRIPSLKPLQFFEKSGKNEESKQFISILCGYLTLNYKLFT